MRGLILAAGRGRRLQGVMGNHPKCLARVGAHTLIERQVSALHECGITAITVVSGYGAAEVRRVCGSQVNIIRNPRFASTNSLYSFWLARDRLRGGFVVLNADVLFHRQLLVDLMTARYEDALLLGAPADGARYSDEEMKVRVRANRVVEIAKTIDPHAADGESMGIAKFGRAGAAVLVEEADRLIAAGAVREWLPSALAVFSRRRPLHVVESRGFPWIEIDSPEDYWRAHSDVLGALEGPGKSRPASPAARAAAFHSRRTTHHV